MITSQLQTAETHKRWHIILCSTWCDSSCHSILLVAEQLVVLQVKLEQGIQVLKTFKSHVSKTSILDDFEFYEARQRSLLEKKAKRQQFQKQVMERLCFARNSLAKLMQNLWLNQITHHLKQLNLIYWPSTTLCDQIWPGTSLANIWCELKVIWMDPNWATCLQHVFLFGILHC